VVRHSFAVLPFALALPAGWAWVAVVIATQSLVELFGMLFCRWWLSGRLFPWRPLRFRELPGTASTVIAAFAQPDRMLLAKSIPCRSRFHARARGR
jgi:hypothetical protein